MALASDQDVGVVREPPPPAVAVADRDDPDAGVLFGHEAPAVAGALAGRAGLDLGHVGAQLEGRLEAPLGRVAAEGIHAVDGDAAADHAELRAHVAQHRGAVGGVDQHARVALGDPRRPAREGRQLSREEAFVIELVGRREMGHRPGQLDTGHLGGQPGDLGGLLGVARPQAPHARVELDVDPSPARGGDGLQVGLVPDDHIAAGGQRLAQFDGCQGAHDDHPLLAQPRFAELAQLAGARNGQPGCPAGHGGPGGLDGAVAVAVGLDDGAECRPVAQSRPQPGCSCARSRPG